MSRAKGHWGKTQHEDAEPWTLSWLLFSLLWQKRKAVCLEGLPSSARDVMAAGLRQSVSVHARSGKRVVRDGAQCPSPSQSGTPACGKIPSVYQVSLPSWKLLWEHTSDTPTGILTRGTMRLSITEVTTWRGGAREVGFTQSPVRTIPVRGGYVDIAATWWRRGKYRPSLLPVSLLCSSAGASQLLKPKEMDSRSLNSPGLS